jgi:acetylornithine/succinyldiaminopimelate/putrescine aminotransferase
LVVQRRHESVLGVSSHATTFGGTALGCAAAIAVYETIEADDVLFNVRKMGEHLRGGLVQLAQKYPSITDVRGHGLILGAAFAESVPVGEVIAGAAAQGLIVLSSAGNVLRLLPALTIDDADLQRGLAILDTVLGGLGK